MRAGNRHCSLYETLQMTDTPKAVDALEQLSTFRRRARMDPLTVLLDHIFAQTHLDSICTAMDDGDVRRENLQTFYQIAVNFEGGGHRDLGRFLEYLDAMEEKGLVVSSENTGGGAVTLML